MVEMETETIETETELMRTITYKLQGEVGEIQELYIADE